MTLNKNITEEDIINSFVDHILSEDADFQFMSEDEQAKIYGIYQLLLTAVHRALAHDNVYPVVYANDDASKSIEVILSAVVDAISEGLNEREEEKKNIQNQKKEETDSKKS